MISREDRLEIYRWVAKNAGMGNRIVDKVLGLLQELDLEDESITEALTYPMEDIKFVRTANAKRVLEALRNLVGLHLKAIDAKDKADSMREMVVGQNNAANETISLLYDKLQAVRAEVKHFRQLLLAARQDARDAQDDCDRVTTLMKQAQQVLWAVRDNAGCGEPEWHVIENAARQLDKDISAYYARDAVDEIQVMTEIFLPEDPPGPPSKRGPWLPLPPRQKVYRTLMKRSDEIQKGNK